MARPLYLHEVIDIVGDKAVDYMEKSVLGFHTSSAADRGLDLYGTFYVMGSTGRWPQVVSVWELPEGWDSWERLCRSTNLKREANAELNDWWLEALQRRSGGFDRLLGAMPGSKTIADIEAEGVSGTVFVHELTQVPPGRAVEYLSSVADQLAPLRADYGHTLVGSWEVLMTDTEVCTLWATTLEDHVRLGKAADTAWGFDEADGGDRRLVLWDDERAKLTTRWREELLVPCPGTLMGPAEWER
ncbi:MAG: hypothetical protein HYX32_09750 [Actinobacteria bacterium]|nr:hypothetical protein [Actinomycetota bacterium]